MAAILFRGRWVKVVNITYTCCCAITRVLFNLLTFGELSKFGCRRKRISYGNFKLVTRTKFQLEILTTYVIFGFAYFREIILESLRNVSETIAMPFREPRAKGFLNASLHLLWPVAPRGWVWGWGCLWVWVWVWGAGGGCGGGGLLC